MSATFYVKDYRTPHTSDSAAVEACMAAARQEFGFRTVIFDGEDYHLDRAVLVPSNTTVIIDNCTVKQNDYVFDNLFRGDNLLINGIDPYGAPLNVTPLRNVRILGKGEAVLMGTDRPQTGYHPYFKETQPMTGDFWGWRTFMCCFSNVKKVEISGLKLRQPMGWAVSFDNCQDVYVHDLDIRSDVKNGDGVDLRSGCHHCIIENITGTTSDDTVACTALSRGKRKREPSRYLTGSEPYNDSHESINGDIHHVVVRNIFTGGLCHGLICLAAWGNQVHHIDISNIKETDEGGRQSTVKIYTGYGDGYRKGDIHHVAIRDVVSRKAEYTLMIDCEPEALTYRGLEQHNPKGRILYER